MPRTPTQEMFCVSLAALLSIPPGSHLNGIMIPIRHGKLHHVAVHVTAEPNLQLVPIAAPQHPERNAAAGNLSVRNLNPAAPARDHAAEPCAVHSKLERAFMRVTIRRTIRRFPRSGNILSTERAPDRDKSHYRQKRTRVHSGQYTMYETMPHDHISRRTRAERLLPPRSLPFRQPRIIYGSLPLDDALLRIRKAGYRYISIARKHGDDVVFAPEMTRMSAGPSSAEYARRGLSRLVKAHTG
jgi:hypothetical protein